MDYKRLFKGKRVLVLGGTGSIGSVIVKKLLRYDPKQVRVFSRDESKHHDLLLASDNHPKLRSLIGDVRDRDRLHFAMRNIDIIFNAAALKHVPFCEYNPFEAVKTNVYGTQNVIDTALKHNVEKVITISTDKATEPSSTLGATKLLAEKLTIAASAYKGGQRTRFAAVRFGNVLGSSNSLLPVIKRQVFAGKPVTITDKRMTRFIMPTESAVGLVLEAASTMKGGEIFVLKMPSVRVEDLIKAYVELLQEEYPDLPAVTYRYIGKRPGEKIDEKLLAAHEVEYAYEKDDLFVIPHFVPGGKAPKSKKTVDVSGYDSGVAEKLSKDEIKDILRNLEKKVV